MKQFKCTKCGFQFPYADDATEIQCPSCSMKYGKQKPKSEPDFFPAQATEIEQPKSARERAGLAPKSNLPSVLGLVFIIVVAIILGRSCIKGGGNSSSSSSSSKYNITYDSKSTTKSPTKATSTPIPTKAPNYKKDAITLDYETLLRYPEKYKGTIVKLRVNITRVDSETLLGVEYDKNYWADYDGEEIILNEDRDVKEPSIVKGDTITVYGICNGLIRVDRKKQGIILDKTVESYEVPLIKLKVVE